MGNAMDYMISGVWFSTAAFGAKIFSHFELQINMLQPFWLSYAATSTWNHVRTIRAYSLHPPSLSKVKKGRGKAVMTYKPKDLKQENSKLSKMTNRKGSYQ